MVKQITVLGSTGSIGVSTLDVIARHPERFHVFALAAQRSVELIFKQCLQFQPRYAVLVDESAAEQLSKQLRTAGSATEVLQGTAALAQVAEHGDVDYVITKRMWNSDFEKVGTTKTDET